VGRDLPHPSRPALASIQPAVRWVSGLFWRGGGVKRLERDVDHSPASSAEVKERVELFLYSSGSLWQVIGRILSSSYAYLVMCIMFINNSLCFI
jgi:hypothetical protein